ncbi:hypothetical protein RSK20926_11634 [Roseobacter sp. SK209-2-6]|uniref:hypothetical protein n=1 Tax=Roseobacter sp. SK209-2-6 TaxID=388739 RepID=UPI0000F3C4F4|nr:hypothetical protein [Roseobacter sp. SK209-2-6]EBA18368.1 hypothetical protein RSK20926_11634 [Roseobacter sp. SK209-2-6]
MTGQKRPIERDIDGETVQVGDRIAFSFGLPPVRVEGIICERDGELILPTPAHKPTESTLDEIRDHCGGFWKVGLSEHEYQATKSN